MSLARMGRIGLLFLSVFMVSSGCSKDQPTVAIPDFIPESPYPVDGSTDQAIVGWLSWSSPLDPSYHVVYDVYFGTSTNPPLVSSHKSEPMFRPGKLQYGTAYYWRVVATNDGGQSAPGPVWHYTTSADNLPPYEPVNVAPGVNALNQPPNSILSWEGLDRDGDPLTFDVYLAASSENPNPPLVSAGQTVAQFDPGMLEPRRDYVWRVVAHDDHGNQSSGPIWGFTTAYDLSVLSLVGRYAVLPVADVVVDGSYAYVVGNGSGVSVIDVSQPSAPLLVSSLSLSSRGYHLVKQGNYLYIATYGELLIVDVSAPGQPKVRGSYTARISDVCVSDSLVYVLSSPGICAINVVQPSTPVLSGVYAADGILFCGIAVKGRTVVAGQGNGRSVSAVSFADASRPVLLWEKPADTVHSIQLKDVCISGSDAYLTSDRDWGGLFRCPIESGESITRVGSYRLYGYGVEIVGRYAYVLSKYVAGSHKGLVVGDVEGSPEGEPSGGFETAEPLNHVFIVGNHIYAAAGNEGLLILQFTP